jgi:hypothetical protein
MIEFFFNAMRVFWVAGQINMRHRLQSPKALDYHHHPLEQSLFDHLRTSKSGVFVHWGVYESGKTTVARNAAWRLQEEAQRQVIFFSGFEFTYSTLSVKSLRKKIGVPEDMDSKALTDFFMQDKKTIIMIDHFDMFMCSSKNENAVEETLDMVRELIKESEATQKFNVLLIITSWERAKELVDAGCTLVPGDAPARWTGEQLESLFDTLQDKREDMMVGEKKKELLRLATLAGTPGFLSHEAHSQGICFGTRHAAMFDLEWRRGMNALYGGHFELGSNVKEGRFPDRNGIYHHEDLKSLEAIYDDHY